MLLVTAALKQEIAVLKRQINIEDEMVLPPCRFFKGHIEGQAIGVLLTSVCPSVSQLHAAIAAIVKKYPVERAILSGCAGALVPGLAAGDVVVASDILLAEDDRRFECDGAWREHVLSALSTVSLHIHEGVAITVNRPILDKAEKEAVAQKTAAIAVEMENAYLASVLVEHGIPFVSVRSIFDPMDMIFPESLYQLVDAEGQFSPKSGLNLVVKTPKDLLKIPLFARHAQKSSAAIAKAIGVIVSHEELFA